MGDNVQTAHHGLHRASYTLHPREHRASQVDQHAQSAETEEEEERLRNHVKWSLPGNSSAGWGSHLSGMPARVVVGVPQRKVFEGWWAGPNRDLKEPGVHRRATTTTAHRGPGSRHVHGEDCVAIIVSSSGVSAAPPPPRMRLLGSARTAALASSRERLPSARSRRTCERERECECEAAVGAQPARL